MLHAERLDATRDEPGLSRLMADATEPLPGFDDPAFGRMFDRYADRRVVPASTAWTSTT